MGRIASQHREDAAFRPASVLADQKECATAGKPRLRDDSHPPPAWVRQGDLRILLRGAEVFG